MTAADLLLLAALGVVPAVWALLCCRRWLDRRGGGTLAEVVVSLLVTGCVMAALLVAALCLAVATG